MGVALFKKRKENGWWGGKREALYQKLDNTVLIYRIIIGMHTGCTPLPTRSVQKGNGVFVNATSHYSQRAEKERSPRTSEVSTLPV